MANNRNLLALAKYLDELALPDHFDMNFYVDRKDDGGFGDMPAEVTKQEINTCGTVACAVGHLPVLFAPEQDENWDKYVERVLDVRGYNDPVWDWMFSPPWAGTDNTPKGAAARIRYYVEHGLPSDWEDQRDGDAMLCYQITA